MPSTISLPATSLFQTFPASPFARHSTGICCFVRPVPGSSPAIHGRSRISTMLSCLTAPVRQPASNHRSLSGATAPQSPDKGSAGRFFPGCMSSIPGIQDSRGPPRVRMSWPAIRALFRISTTGGWWFRPGPFPVSDPRSSPDATVPRSPDKATRGSSPV